MFGSLVFLSVCFLRSRAAKEVKFLRSLALLLTGRFMVVRHVHIRFANEHVLGEAFRLVYRLFAFHGQKSSPSSVSRLLEFWMVDAGCRGPDAFTQVNCVSRIACDKGRSLKYVGCFLFICVFAMIFNPKP